MKIKIKEKPSQRMIRFSDLCVGALFEYGANLYIKTEELYEVYDDEHSRGTAINLDTGILYEIEDNESVSKYVGSPLEIEDNFQDWI